MMLWKRFAEITIGSLLSLGPSAVLKANGNVIALTPAQRLVNCTTAALSVTSALHDNRTIALNRAAGVAVTLPAAKGTGTKLKFIVGTTVTSSSTTIKVANATDIMAGLALQSQDAGNTVQAWETASTDDTITFNGSTTGGIKGDMVELEDIASGLWSVRVVGAATGTEATPFSATV